MLLLLGRLFLLALPHLLKICLPSLWSPPSSLLAATLMPLSLVKVWLSPILTLSPLMIWYSGLTALFLFLFTKMTLAYLLISAALRSLFLFQQAQYVQVFRLKPAPFCMLFAGLGSTNKSITSHLFSSYLTLVLSLPPGPLLHLSFYLNLPGRSGKNCLLSPPVLSGYNESLDTRFSWRMKQLMSWPYRERFLHPLQSLVISLLLPFASTLLFS